MYNMCDSGDEDDDVSSDEEEEEEEEEVTKAKKGVTKKVQKGVTKVRKINQSRGKGAVENTFYDRGGGSSLGGIRGGGKGEGRGGGGGGN